MLKQLTLSLICISSLSLAQIPVEKLEELKKQIRLEVLESLKQEALEKHLSEKEKAINDLKTAGIGGIGAIGLSAGVSLLNHLEVPIWISRNCGAPTSDFIGFALFVSGISICTYSAYKGVKGTRHLLIPDHPKPEDATKKELDAHA